MEYRAHVENDPLSGLSTLRLIARGNIGTSVATGIGSLGDVHFMEQDEGVYVEPFLRLPSDAMLAVRDALNGHAPPTDDTDLREALSVERERVDKVINNALRQGVRTW